MKNDIGVDIGTANTLIYMKSKGIVVNEPSVVALDKEYKSVLAVGTEAKEMLGKTPSAILSVCPIREGVIAEFDTAQSMLKSFVRKAFSKKAFVNSRVVACVPINVPAVEKQVIKDALINSGAREVFVVEKPMAAAIGANLPVSEPIASMIVDIGCGTTEIAVISLGGIVCGKTVKTAGGSFDRAVEKYIKRAHALLIGEQTAEKIKIELGSAFDVNDGETLEVSGSDYMTGLPKNAVITAEEIRGALKDSLMGIIEAIKDVLEDTPPELSADIIERGITLTGGGALLRGIDSLIKKEVGMPVYIADEPKECTANGTGIILDDIDLIRKDSLYLSAK